jgi:phage repressor protein C with HTH and peptisase S24 domain
MLRDVPISRIPRPAFHAPEVDLFGIYLQSDDMEPRYERGDRLLVNRSLPLVPGKDVLLLSEKDQEGRQRAIVRRLLAILADGYQVRRYNPAQDEHAPLVEWPFAYFVESARWR